MKTHDNFEINEMLVNKNKHDYLFDYIYDLTSSYELLVEQSILLDDYLHDKESCSTVETATIKKLVKQMKGEF